jgi:sodium transport system permease protein
MKRPLATVFVKELRDALRDRRTALMVLVASILTGPLTLVLVAQFISGLEQKASILKVRIAGQENAPVLVNFLQRADVEIETAPADYEARIREGRLDAVIVVPGDFDERFLAGDKPRVEIVYDDSRTESGPAIRQAERLLRAFNSEAATLRLMARGVSPDLTEPVKVQHVNTATPQQKGAFLLFLIPMFAILSPLLGGMTIAIDSTAGERERGSLEPLLANPVPRWQLVAGKWLAAWSFASVVAVLTLGGFVLAASAYAGRRLAALMAFGAPELGYFVAMVIPLAAMTAAVQMLICTYGRSYREAQTYVSYLATVVSFVPLVVLFSGMKDAFWHPFVPVLGQLMVMTRVIRGEAVTAIEWAIPSAVAFALAVACVAAVSRLLRDEQIVFGRGVLVAEAGTGTGKTFAYLVPALLVRRQGHHLHRHQDAAGPALPARPAAGARRAGIGVTWRCSRAAPTTSALPPRARRSRRALQGRARTRATSAHRALRARSIAAATAASAPTSRRIRRRGPRPPRRARTAWARRARHYEECFVMKARKRRLEADVVVVNHHLFFADVALRDEGVAELLPACNTVIFDEAHQLPDLASLSSASRCHHPAGRAGARRARGPGAARAREHRHGRCRRRRGARGARPAPRPGQRHGAHRARRIRDRKAFDRALDALAECLGALAARLQAQAERAEEIRNCHGRAGELLGRVAQWREADARPREDAFGESAGPDVVRWIEAYAHSAVLYATPLDVGRIFHAQMEGAGGHGSSPRRRSR